MTSNVTTFESRKGRPGRRSNSTLVQFKVLGFLSTIREPIIKTGGASIGSIIIVSLCHHSSGRKEGYYAAIVVIIIIVVVVGGGGGFKCSGCGADV